DAAWLDTVARLERREIMIERPHVVAATRLRQHDPVRLRADDRGKVIEDHPGSERVDANEEPRPAGRGADEIAGDAPRLRLALGDDGILEVEDQHVGFRAEALGEFLLAVAGDKKQR